MTTDTLLQREIEEELRWEPSLEATHIRVSADGGVVSLSGHVKSFREKQMAAEAARRVDGVGAIANELRVQLPSSMVRKDKEIAEAVARALNWNSAVPDEEIRISVSGGVVILAGCVDWHYQRRAALREVTDLVGVVGVVNQLKVRSSPTSEEVKERIEDALQRSTRVDARRILVGYSGGTATLRGTVRSWAEHDEAGDTAWAARGVTRVENLLTVGWIGSPLTDDSLNGPSPRDRRSRVAVQDR